MKPYLTEPEYAAASDEVRAQYPVEKWWYEGFDGDEDILTPTEVDESQRAEFKNCPISIITYHPLNK